jgi:hypothetical protein
METKAPVHQQTQGFDVTQPAGREAHRFGDLLAMETSSVIQYTL